MRLIVLLLVLVAGGASVAGRAGADDLADAVARFADGSFTATAEAVTLLARSGDERAVAIIGALGDGRLSASKSRRTVVITDAAGALVEAATGLPLAGDPPPDLKAVRLNNLVRGAVAAALGALTLRAADPETRRRAAETVFASRERAALPAVEAALAEETEPRIRRLLGEARAAIVVADPAAAEDDRLAAVAVLADRGGEGALAILRSLPADAPARVSEQAAEAIRSLEGALAVWNAVQNAWYGLSLGSVLLLAAVGLAITFGVMGVINMAHGEMVMLGAYTTFIVQDILRSHWPGAVEYSLLLAVPAAFAVSGLFGIAIERGVIRHLYGRPLETLLATWGLSLILQQLVRTVFGPTNREVAAPSWMAGSFSLGHLSITSNRLAIILFSLGVLVLLAAVLRWTTFGLHMRAVTQNRPMAASMGIATGRIDALTFGLGSGIAGMAGVALSQIDNVSPNLGQSYIIDSFMVVVFGGVGNLWGTLVGAFSLGLANKFMEPFAGAVLAKILVLVAIILFIQRRPRGLFAPKGRAIEA